MINKILKHKTTLLLCLSLWSGLSIASNNKSEEDSLNNQVETPLWSQEPLTIKEKIVGKSFGTMTYRGGELYSVKPVMDNQFIADPSRHYGWLIKLYSTKNIINWKEEVYARDLAENDPLETQLYGKPEHPLGKPIHSEQGRALSIGGYIHHDMSYNYPLALGEYTVKVTLSNGLESYIDYSVVSQ